MNLKVKNLPEDPALLKQIVAELIGEYKRSKGKIQHLKEYVRLLQKEIHGRKSEKHPLIETAKASGLKPYHYQVSVRQTPSGGN